MDCHWRANGKAWMNTEIFSEWLRWFNNRVSPRKVLLIMDNFSAHAAAVEANDGLLNNLVICYLPPNVTSKYQPLDQGVIASFKSYYRRSWLQYMVDEFDEGRNPLYTTNVLKALRWTLQAWQFTKQSSIANCWYHSTLITRPSELQAPPQGLQDDVTEEVTQLVQQLQLNRRITNPMAIENFLNPEEEVVKDTDEDIIQSIIEEFTPQPDHESDEEVEVIPKVSFTTALHCLTTLRVYEEQQGDAELPLLKSLNEHENLILRRRQRGGQQAVITRFFARPLDPFSPPL